MDLVRDPFSPIHRDLITETTINREVKVRGGPMRGGLSTSEATNDAFIKTSHLMAKIRSKLKDKFDILTSSVHKELTTGSRLKHDRIVESLFRTLEEHLIPFLDGPTRHIITGREIEKSVMAGLLSSDETGEKRFIKFVNERMMRSDETRASFFDPIPKTNVKRGMEREKKANKKMKIARLLDCLLVKFQLLLKP